MEVCFRKYVSIPVGEVILKGELIIPANAAAVIIFSHGSGSSRFSQRNRTIAKHLHEMKFGTLLADLLTEEEDQRYYSRFDIKLLTSRLIGVTEWFDDHTNPDKLPIGLFGEGTGAASALNTSAILPEKIDAVVSRSGRPDLAGNRLSAVQAPTLLIAGSLDDEVVQLSQHAFSRLSCEKRLAVINGASHLFDEPGKIEIVAEIAGKWFQKYLMPNAQPIPVLQEFEG